MGVIEAILRLGGTVPKTIVDYICDGGTEGGQASFNQISLHGVQRKGRGFGF